MEGALVDAAPGPWPRVVAQQAGLAVAFFLDGGWGEHEVLHVSDLVVGQDGPKAVLDELGHLLSKEGGMLGGGRVTPTADALIFLFESPRLGGGLNRDPMLSPVREHWGSRVVEVLELSREIGRTSEIMYETLPGRGAGETGG